MTTRSHKQTPQKPFALAGDNRKPVKAVPAKSTVLAKAKAQAAQAAQVLTKAAAKPLTPPVTEDIDLDEITLSSLRKDVLTTARQVSIARAAKAELTRLSSENTDALTSRLRVAEQEVKQLRIELEQYELSRSREMIPLEAHLEDALCAYVKATGAYADALNAELDGLDKQSEQIDLF